MPKPIDRTTPADVPELHPEPQKTESQSSPERDHVAAFTTPAADAAMGSIESNWGWGLAPDMPSIEKNLFALEGFDLLQVTHQLEDKEKLEPLLNAMSPGERQQLVNQLVKGGIVERQPPPGDKLLAKYVLPQSLKGMVDEMSALQLHQKRSGETHLNWSSYNEDAYDRLGRTFKQQATELEPGDSITLDAKVGAFAGVVTVSGEMQRGISRSEDGTFRAHAEVGGQVGLYGELDAKVAEVRLEGGVGCAMRVEYAFPTAEAAAAAALNMTDPEELEKLGKPSAVEFNGKFEADLIGHLGPNALRMVHAVVGLEGTVGIRVELDKKPPELVLKASDKGHADVGAMLGRGHVEVELHGPDAKAESKIEVELRIPIEDADALLASPKEYFKAHGTEMAAAATYKATVSQETSALHHASTTELSVSGRGESVLNFVNVAGTKPWKQALAQLGRESEVDLREKDYELKHVGIGGRVHSHAGGGELSLGIARKSLEKEHVIYKGNGLDFISGKPHRPPEAP